MSSMEYSLHEALQEQSLSTFHSGDSERRHQDISRKLQSRTSRIPHLTSLTTTQYEDSQLTRECSLPSNIRLLPVVDSSTNRRCSKPKTINHTNIEIAEHQKTASTEVINRIQGDQEVNQSVQALGANLSSKLPGIAQNVPKSSVIYENERGVKVTHDKLSMGLFNKLPSLGPLNIENLDEFLEKSKKDFDVLYREKTTYDCNLSNFKLIKTLGKGSFAKVILARSKDDNMQCAIKIMNKQEVIKKKQVLYVISEKRILQALNFPFTINLKCYFADNHHLYFVMPYVSGGDFSQYLLKLKFIKECYAKFYVGQLVLALEYLHYLGLIHRDIKPVNIVVDGLGYLKVADFGQCIRVVSKDKTWTMTGTPEYMAPEIIINKGYDFAVDWWSLGVVTFEMCAGFRPFTGDTIEKVYKLILRGKYNFPDHFSNKLKTFISRLLQSAPSRRVSKDPREMALKIKSLPWLKDTDWLALLNRIVPPPQVPLISSPHTHEHVSTHN